MREPVEFINKYFFKLDVLIKKHSKIKTGACTNHILYVFQTLFCTLIPFKSSFLFTPFLLKKKAFIANFHLQQTPAIWEQLRAFKVYRSQGERK